MLLSFQSARERHFLPFPFLFFYCHHDAVSITEYRILLVPSGKEGMTTNLIDSSYIHSPQTSPAYWSLVRSSRSFRFSSFKFDHLNFLSLFLFCPLSLYITVFCSFSYSLLPPSRLEQGSWKIPFSANPIHPHTFFD